MIDTFNYEPIVYGKFVGKHTLSGVEHCFHDGYSGLRLIIDNETYEVLCDPCDGYRSSCSGLFKTTEKCCRNLPNVKVEIKRTDSDFKNNTDIDGLVFIIDDNRKPRKPILLVGTDMYDGWYPSCVMDYTPENLTE